MEQLWTRQKIRLHCNTVLGDVTSETDNPDPVDDLNAAIEEAYACALMDATWARAELDWTGTVGAQQRLLNYPAGAGPGSVLEVAIWMGTVQRWKQLTHARIPAAVHPDPLETAGGEEWSAACGEPQFYDQRAQIHLAPATDKAYEIKIRYRPVADFNDDDDVPSAIDGLLIALKTLELYSESPLEDEPQARRFEHRYAKRLRQLKGAMNTGQQMPLSAAGGWYGGQPPPPQANIGPYPAARTVIDDTGF